MFVKSITYHFLRTISSSVTPSLKEKIIKIGNYDINYVKLGRGPHQLLFTPGVLGTIMSHYKYQIEDFDKEKFTLVVFDPPGYGKSGPLSKRILDMKSYERDADIAYELMKYLNVSKYSCLGWSAGGTAGMILAAKYPQVVHKLVVWGAMAFIHEKDIKTYELLQDLSYWHQDFKRVMIETYGEKNFVEMWVKLSSAMYDNMINNPDICTKDLKNITCPTLILHGKRDIVADISHMEYLCNNIKNARCYPYPDGKHYIHLYSKEDFNQRVQQVLLEE